MQCFYQCTSLCVKDMYYMSLTKKLYVVTPVTYFFKHMHTEICFKKWGFEKNKN